MQGADEIRVMLGAGGILTAEADMAPYLTDWRGRYTGRARAVVLPRSTEHVVRLVRWCAGHQVAIVPQGGNTGLVGGATPDASGQAIVLSTRRLNRIREIDITNDTMTVEAGCLLQDVQQAAQEHRRLFPLSLAAQGSCTIGGNLATNAGGTQVLRYGNARDLTLGLEVVLADGTLWDGLRGLRKDNTGYDCKQLFIGAEGTLGVITAACVKLFAAPRSQVVCLLATPSLGAAIELLQQARAAAGAALTAFEVMSDVCIELLARSALNSRAAFDRPHPWLVLLEYSGHEEQDDAARNCERLCAQAMEGGAATDAILSRSLGDCTALWRLREAIPEAQARAGGNVKHDVSLPLARIETFVAECVAGLAALEPQLQAMVFGHLGDGNLHFNVGVRSGSPAQAAFALETRINDIVYSAVQRHGGSISAEHGLGQLRRELGQSVKSPAERTMMRAIKHALDPENRMNPGKLI